MEMSRRLRIGVGLDYLTSTTVENTEEDTWLVEPEFRHRSTVTVA